MIPTGIKDIQDHQGRSSIFASNSFVVAARGGEQFCRLKLHETRSRPHHKSFQLEKLRRLLILSALHVPYYRDLFKSLRFEPRRVRRLEDIKELPILSKQIVRGHQNALMAQQNLSADERHLIQIHTTGSTGLPLPLLLTRSEFIKGLTYIAYGFTKSGARITDRFVQMLVPSPHRGSFAFERLGILQQHYIDLRQGVERAMTQLEQIKPHVIYGYPSFLSLMAAHLLQHQPLSWPVRLVITHGEMLSDEIRSRLADAFACPVRDSYGAAEVFRIAYECPYQRLHIIPDSVHVEIDESTIDSDGSAEIVVTPLYLKTMPLIRYKLGDRVILSNDPCPCGFDFTTIRKITGRSDDNLTLPSGKKISPRAINVLEDVPGIIEYQIIQKSRSRFEVLVKAGSEFGPASQQQVEQTITRGCAPESVQVEISIVQAVHRASNGKLNAVISEVDDR